MSDETTVKSAVNGRTILRAEVSDGKTYIRDAITNRIVFYIEGVIGGGVEVMTTAQRTAIVPEEGQLIYDSNLDALYVGDGHTVGGVAVGSGGGGEGGTPATVKDIMTGSGASKILNVTNIRGALTSGQAVDVTSQPDGVTGDYRGTFSATGSLGFTSFPKYASGLNYLMIADLTATTSGTVTPSGTWLDGTTTAKSITGGTSTRVAMLFNAANKAKFTFASTGSVSVTNCREYEVTACSAEAVAYIAQLANPDAFASYYLVKPDMVQPWTSIIDMGSSSAVTIASGLSYKLTATGTHTLTVDTCPAGYDGRDAIIRITLGGTGVIQAVFPLQLGGALVPYAINNCVVNFRDGEAVLLVEDTLAGYVVTVTSGTDNGSLAYGLAATGIPYIAFSTGTDGSVVDMGNVVTANEEVTVVGNGYTNTAITGNITCTNKTTVANLSLQDVNVMGGVMILGDAFIPSGSTVAVSGGGLAIEKVTGDGGVIDLGKTQVSISSGTTARASGCTITGGSAYDGGVFVAGNAMFADCIISGNSGTAGYFTVARYGTATLSGCTVCSGTWNLAGTGKLGMKIVGGGTMILTDTLFTDGLTIDSGSAVFSNTVTMPDKSVQGSGSVTIASGAVLDLTGNTNATPIAPGSVTIQGGGTQIVTGATAGVADNTAIISGGAGAFFRCASILSDGTLECNAANRHGGTNILFDSVKFKMLSGAGVFDENGTATFKDCSANGGFYTGTTATNNYSIIISGTYESNINRCFQPVGASVYNGSVTLADGCSVTMTAAGATIFVDRAKTIVVGSGCKINGNAITSGTYTSATLKKDGTITEA